MRKLRKERGHTQVSLANLLGVVQSTIQGWETGCYYPNIENLALLAEILEVSTTEMLILLMNARENYLKNEGENKNEAI